LNNYTLLKYYYTTYCEKFNTSFGNTLILSPFSLEVYKISRIDIQIQMYVYSYIIEISLFNITGGGLNPKILNLVHIRDEKGIICKKLVKEWQSEGQEGSI